MPKELKDDVGERLNATAKELLNIENFINKSKKDNAYTIVEINGALPEEIVEKITAIEGVVRVNIIK